MRLISWLFKLGLFLVMMGFALSNTETATLRFFGIPEFEWRAPLVLFLLVPRIGAMGANVAHVVLAALYATTFDIMMRKGVARGRAGKRADASRELELEDVSPAA